VGSFGEVSLDEQSAMLDAELRPDGNNIGIDDGAAAGQTVMHVHMHVIPRYRGDRPDLGGTMREGFAGSFRRRPTIGAAGANDYADDLRKALRIFQPPCPGSLHSQKVQPFTGLSVIDTAADEGES